MIIKYHISVAVYIDYIHTHLTITFELSSRVPTNCAIRQHVGNLSAFMNWTAIICKPSTMSLQLFAEIWQLGSAVRLKVVVSVLLRLWATI